MKLVADAQSTVIDQLRAQLVEQDCRAHVAPSAMPDFLARLNMTEVTNDQGGVDYAKLAQNRDAILEANSHLRAPDPRMPLAAPAANVSDSTSPYSTPGGGEV